MTEETAEEVRPFEVEAAEGRIRVYVDGPVPLTLSLSAANALRLSRSLVTAAVNEEAAE